MKEDVLSWLFELETELGTGVDGHESKVLGTDNVYVSIVKVGENPDSAWLGWKEKFISYLEGREGMIHWRRRPVFEYIQARGGAVIARVFIEERGPS